MLRPGTRGGGLDDHTLDHEAVRGLHDHDFAHAALVEECTDRPQNFLVVLARTAVVDPHLASSHSPTCGRTVGRGPTGRQRPAHPVPRGPCWASGAAPRGPATPVDPMRGSDRATPPSRPTRAGP